MNRNQALNYLASRGANVTNPFWSQISDAELLGWVAFYRKCQAVQERAVKECGGTLVRSAESFTN